MSTVRAPIAADVRWSSYRIVGSTIDDLRGAIALLGPRRGKCAFGGATEWRVEWTFEARPGEATDQTLSAAAFALESLQVGVRAEVRLPEWRPARHAAQGAVAAFTRYRAALEAHERGHVAIALRAARCVREALASMPPEATVRALEELAAVRAERVLDAFRRCERAFDDATAHGARDGVVLDRAHVAE